MKPPADLTPATAAWWRNVMRSYALEPHHRHLLTLAGRALDRAEQARLALAEAGSLTFTDERGMIRAHPAVAIERDCRTSFARLLRELDLDTEPPAAPPRPPGLRSNGR